MGLQLRTHGHSVFSSSPAMKSPLVLLVCVLTLANAALKQLPNSLKRCKEVDTDTNMICIRDAVQNAIPQFVKGFQSLGVLSIDPLLVTEMTIGEDKGGPVSIVLHFRNESIRGFGDMVIKSVTGSTKLEDYNLHFNVFIPNFQLIGDYTVNGKVLVLPIRGTGYSNLTLTQMRVTADIMGRPSVRKGEKYLDITEFKLDIVPERLYIQFDNLFNGDPALGPNMNKFLNDNWSDIYNELKPSIADTFGAIFKEISNRIYSRVPYKNIVL